MNTCAKVDPCTCEQASETASAKVDLLTFGSGVMTNRSYHAVGDETHSLILSANVADFGKAGHICFDNGHQINDAWL